MTEGPFKILSFAPIFSKSRDCVSVGIANWQTALIGEPRSDQFFDRTCRVEPFPNQCSLGNCNRTVGGNALIEGWWSQWTQAG